MEQRKSNLRDSMVVFPNVKINIGLSITGKRPDGYHNIESVMYPVGWCESLELVDRSVANTNDSMIQSRVESGKVRFTSYGIPIPGDASTNLCIRVFHLLEEWFNLPTVDIHLLKTLPIGAGLGGGSADAAFCLRALKDYFELKISDHEAKRLLAVIGSDCPFFWENKPVFSFGRGDEMRPIGLDLSGKWIMLVYPDLAISTKEAYAGVEPKASSFDLQMLQSVPIEAWKEVVFNDFEKSLFPTYRILETVKNEIYELGALYASMTGSGSTLYGIFDTRPELPETWIEYPHWVGKL
ncbi:MAG: 4-(cytidine 5'-diphospho)-2-C-methyl-D-erythritol kinase [Flavobacteriales bacterium]